MEHRTSRSYSQAVHVDSESQEDFKEVLSKAGNEHSKACTLVLRGDFDDALQELDKVLRKGIRAKSWARQYQNFTELRNYPGFRQITTSDDEE